MPSTSSNPIVSPQKATNWSSIDSASRKPPSAPRAMASAASRRKLDLFQPGDLLQMRGDERGRDAAQVEALAAGQDGGQHLLRLGRREDEFHVLGRLLQRLEQRVERRGREHVHLVDDVDLVLPVRRGVADVVAQFAHLLDAVVAGAVDFQHVQAAALGDLAAGDRTRRTARWSARARSTGIWQECARWWSCPCRAGRRRDKRARAGSGEWRCSACG